jgi:transcriptional regulator NrdR family protein
VEQEVVEQVLQQVHQELQEQLIQEVEQEEVVQVLLEEMEVRESLLLEHQDLQDYQQVQELIQ